MDAEEMRIAIAQKCGWEIDSKSQTAKAPLAAIKQHGPYGKWSHMDWACIPNYPADLNAMHEAEKALDNEDKTLYIRELNRGDFSYRRLAFATAAQRAEAFCRVFWPERFKE